MHAPTIGYRSIYFYCRISVIMCCTVFFLASCEPTIGTSPSRTTATTPAPSTTPAHSGSALSSSTPASSTIASRTLLVYHGQNRKNTYSIWSPDGRNIASFGSNTNGNPVNTLQVWNAQTGQTLWNYAPPNTIAFLDHLTWSSNGKLIAASVSDTSRGDALQVWNAQTGQVLWKQTYPIGVDLANIAWSADSKRLAVSAGSQCCSSNKIGVEIFDATTGQSLAFNGNLNRLGEIVWSPDSTSIASIGNGIDIWDISTKKITKITYQPGGWDSITWSPNGRFIAVGGSDTQILAIATNKVLCTHHMNTGGSIPLANLAWSVDSQHIFSVSDTSTVQVWNATNCQTLFTYGVQNADSPGNLIDAKWSPDNKYIAIVSQGNDVRVLDATTGATTITYTEHAQPVNSVSWSPDSTLIASTSQDGTVRIWRVTK